MENCFRLEPRGHCLGVPLLLYKSFRIPTYIVHALLCRLLRRFGSRKEHGGGSRCASGPRDEPQSNASPSNLPSPVQPPPPPTEPRSHPHLLVTARIDDGQSNGAVSVPPVRSFNDVSTMRVCCDVCCDVLPCMTSLSCSLAPSLPIAYALCRL